LVCQTGGGIIRRKLFLSVLLLFGLALVLNVNTTAAATTNNTTITTSNNTVTTTAITNSTVKATTKTVAKPEPKITSINPVGNAIVSKSQNIKITYNETIKAGSMWIVLTNSAGTVISTKDVISGKTLTIKPVKASFGC
jgi:methionine-rich copper-binding protein CopC